MKTIALPCILLLAGALAAQTDSSAPVATETDLPASSATNPATAPVTAQTGAAVPSGTALMVRLDTTLATFSNRVGDPFQAKVTQAVVVTGNTLIPVAATVEGRVTKVTTP